MSRSSRCRLTWWVLYRTRFGLRLRAVGENPGAVDTAGVSVVRLRYAAVLIGGVLCGIAGAYLSTGQSAGFVRDMTAGKGFIALAALIFAKWRPVAGARRLPALRLPRGDRHPLPGHPHRRRHHPGAVHAGAALHPDRGHPRRLRRPGDPAQGRRPALRQGALNGGRRYHPRPGGRRARSPLGLVLGSGLGHLTGAVDGVAIDYADLPGFPHAGVSGHQPKLVVGDARRRARRGARRPRPLLRDGRRRGDARAAGGAARRSAPSG